MSIEKTVIEKIEKIIKKQASTWFDDIHYEIFDLKNTPSSHDILIGIRNIQGNFTYHYAGQLQETLNKEIKNLKFKVCFWGNAVLKEIENKKYFKI